MYVYRHTPSGQSRVYGVTQLRTDGVHCRESAGTGPVVAKIAPLTDAAFAGHHEPDDVRFSINYVSPRPLALSSPLPCCSLVSLG